MNAFEKAGVAVALMTGTATIGLFFVNAWLALAVILAGGLAVKVISDAQDEAIEDAVDATEWKLERDEN